MPLDFPHAGKITLNVADNPKKGSGAARCSAPVAGGARAVSQSEAAANLAVSVPTFGAAAQTGGARRAAEEVLAGV